MLLYHLFGSWNSINEIWNIKIIILIYKIYIYLSEINNHSQNNYIVSGEIYFYILPKNIYIIRVRLIMIIPIELISYHISHFSFIFISIL